MKTRSLIVIALAASFAFGAEPIKMPLPKGTRTITVGPDAKVKTIEDALDRVAEFRLNNKKTPLAIRVEPGYYTPERKLHITKKHATMETGPLFIYAADFNDMPRVHAGMRILNWEKTSFNGRDNVWMADVSKLPEIPERRASIHLYFNSRRMQPARWPNVDPKHPYTKGFAYVEQSAPEGTEYFENEIRLRPADVREWAYPTDGVTFARQRHNFGIIIAQIAKIDMDAGVITTDRPRTKVQTKGVMAGCMLDRWYVENMAEELDIPGEWYLDPREKKVYFLPPDGSDPNNAVVTIGRRQAVMKVAGGGNVAIAGMDVSGGMNGIDISGSKVYVMGCKIHDVSGTGMYISGTKNRITDCDIFNIGGMGMLLHSHWGDRMSDYRQENLVDNCYFHHVGEFNPTATGIFNCTQGSRITHNLFHDMPRSAISGYGRFCEISYNRIRHTNLQGDDTGAMYDSLWTQGAGTHICYNWITDAIGFRRISFMNYTHHQGACGIYFDECTGGAHVYGNHIEGCNWAALHLHNARWVTISNNVLVSNGWMPSWHGTHQLSFQTWNEQGFKGRRAEMYINNYKSLVRHDTKWLNVPSLAQDPSTEAAYAPDGTMMMGNKVCNNIFYFPDQGNGLLLFAINLNASTNFFNNNIYWPGRDAKDGGVRMVTGPRGSDSSWKTWQKKTKQDVDSLIADPLFRDPAKKDYRLKSHSPAYKLGFKDIPYDKIGLRKTRFRPVLPKEVEGVREHPEWLKSAKMNMMMKKKK